jgi:hypothetical protein
MPIAGIVNGLLVITDHCRTLDRASKSNTAFESCPTPQRVRFLNNLAVLS